MLLRKILTIISVWVVGSIADAALAQQVVPSALLTIDQNRSTVVERIVAEWGTPLAQSSAGISAEQLRSMLNALRADHLLAASLAGTLPGLRDVMANSLTATAQAKPGMLQTKALGDVSDDLVYTPVSPCRLFDSRPAQGGLGVMNPNVRRTYGAVTPVPSQGGPGGCNAPDGAAVALIQIGTLAPSRNGYLQGGAQGVASFPNALILFQTGDQYGTAVAMPLNVTNGQFDVQVQFASTDLYGDLLGYFKRPSNYGGTHVINSAGYATDSGGMSNTASGVISTVAGGYGNIASGLGSTVGGGAGNTASGQYGTVAGGNSNTASGNLSFAAGNRANASQSGSFIWADAQDFDFGPSVPNFFGVRATGGAGFTVAIDSSGAPTEYCNLLPGVPGWQCTSDRNAKENFVPADGKEILRRLVAMPLFSWNFKGADPSVRSLGPTAQDFYAAFGLGNDELTIASMNLDGVALAAIQGLHQTVRQQMQQIAQLKRELRMVKTKLGL